MVRLLHFSRYRSIADFAAFNPTMVRLLLKASLQALTAENLFQSHNGAIAASGNLIGMERSASFNPTMVRLLLIFHLRVGGCPRDFQSHNGAIAARRV